MKWIFLFVFGAVQIVWAQKSTYSIDSVYNREFLVEDLEMLYQQLIEVHPSIYDFIGEDYFKARYLEIRDQMVDCSEMQFLELISHLIVNVGCGHTVALPSTNWYKRVKTKGKLISLSVKLINDELYIWNQPYEDSVPLQGKKIISINDLGSDLIIKKLKNRISSDGLSKTLPNHALEKSFKAYYTFSEGFSDNHKIKYISKGNRIDSIILPANTVLPKLEKKKSVLDQFSLIFKKETIKYYELNGTKKVALIDIDGFGNSKFKPTYKSIFERINTENINHLVIDLRSNGGGYFPNGNELLTYFFKEDVYFRFSRPKKKVPKSKYLKMNAFSSLTRVLFGIIPDDKAKNNRDDFRIKYKAKKKNQFNGKTYILINNGSFSMSGYVAARLNTLPNVTFIGQETGGGEYGSNAILSYILTLPHTKLRIYLPYYFCDHQLPNIKRGKGIIPDIQVNYSLNDLLEGKDLELIAVLSEL